MLVDRRLLPPHASLVAVTLLTGHLKMEEEAEAMVRARSLYRFALTSAHSLIKLVSIEQAARNGENAEAD